MPTQSAVKEPDLMRLVLQASMAALVNVQSVEAVEGEMKRRAEEKAERERKWLEEVAPKLGGNNFLTR